MNNYDTTILERIHIIQGDITKMDVDAIVNAANPSLLGGGGVDGAIHRAAGPQLLEECRTLGGAKPGEAKITKGYRLPAKYVIHTPGPVYRGGNQHESTILKNSYHNSMQLAKQYNCRSIAFPAISTGVYGYPKDEACRIAIDTVLDFMQKENFLIDVYFVLFDDENFSLYINYLKELSK
ncbi:MAG TPA: O-acetyl-ADP-ribose deacetylase [Spirochaetota bacterium]|nr:O-acetyl-ADP-ribose deacetylase [Spirochaetota bacterium]HOM87833.1 O-acetyl-ADP-ribose deacetylase [Spirochaetota bacterium]HOT20394.1 O-acetyl-ADP-ribose deacetylase [Spirochaetota bacterium]HPD05715.1 O-acetyl-ADP-ribose deacetylase [Spirochaetota bacterium]HQG43724.1 O-acetyl-ADP-ribose deacetylase [Spirochaetota bacterium]